MTPFKNGPENSGNSVVGYSSAPARLCVAASAFDSAKAAIAHV